MTYTLLGEWGFLNNLNDTSGNAHHGTLGRLGGSIVISPTYVTGPTAGTKGIQWGEVGQYVDVGATGLEPATDGYTAMAWVKGPTTSVFSGIFGRARAASSTRAGMQFDDTGKLFRMLRWKSRLDFGSSTAQIDDGNWHHVAVVDDDDRGAVFLDGIKIYENGADATGSPSWEGGFTWIMGAISGLCTSTAGQAVSGVRLLQGILTDAEVLDWMNSPVVESPVVKRWNGSGWDVKPMKVWNGTTWVVKPARVWDGAAWS